MPHLIAGSTNYVTYDPAADLTALTLTIATSTGSAVDYSGTVTEDASANWAVNMSATEITSVFLYDTLTFTWTLTYSSGGSTQTRVDLEHYDVLAEDVDNLVTILECKDHAHITGTTDNELIVFLIAQAQDALSIIHDLPTVPITSEARYVTVRDARFVPLEECVSITSIADESGNALGTDGYTVVYGRTSSNLIRGVILGSAYDGQLTVTGTWGYDDCPYDVRRAILSTVKTWYKRYTVGSDADAIGGFGSLPREARDLMENRIPVSI